MSPINLEFLRHSDFELILRTGRWTGWNTLSPWYVCTLAARPRGNNAHSLLLFLAMRRQRHAVYSYVI